MKILEDVTSYWPSEHGPAIKEVRARLAKEYASSSLDGLAAIASYALLEVIPGSRLVFGCYSNDWVSPMSRHQHCWVQLGDTIYDITSQQYSLENPDILRTSVRDLRYSGEFIGEAAEEHVARYWEWDKIPWELIEKYDRKIK